MKIVRPIVFENYGFSRNSVANYYNSNGILTEAAIDELRLGYNPSTLDFIGPIIEPAATNLVRKSTDFTSPTYWQQGFVGSGVGSDAAVENPDGTAPAQHMAPSGPLWAISSNGLGEVIGDTCFSIYVKEKSRDSDVCSVRLRITSDSGSYNVVFLIMPESYAALGADASIEPLLNGWFRISIKDVMSGSGVVSISRESGIAYMWGAQVEDATGLAGSFPSSFIFTDTTPATRAADIQSAPPSLVSSNVTETDHPDWGAGENYSAGDQVIVRGDYHRVYEALADNTNQFPPDSDDLVDVDKIWLDQGATNRWRMFDMDVGPEKQTLSDNSSNTIEVLLGIDQPINSIVLLNVDASTAQITVRDAEGLVVYEYFAELLEGIYESSWYAFFYSPRRRSSTIVLTDLPPIRPLTLEMILDGGDEQAKIGKMIVGRGVEIGCARYGTGVGIVDFSRKERDPFGNNFVLPRRYVDRAEFDIQLLTSRVDEVRGMLASLRATPVVYIGDEDFKSTVIYGFYRDFSLILAGPKRSDGSLEVEGI